MLLPPKPQPSYVFSGATTNTKLNGTYRRCPDTLRIASGSVCAQTHCAPDKIRAGVWQFEDRCRVDVGIQSPSYEALLANATLGRGKQIFAGTKFIDVSVVGKAAVDEVQRHGVPVERVV
jgi:hypothetical protein